MRPLARFAPLFLVGAGVAAAQYADQPQALTELNQAFRKAYAGAKQRLVAGVDPLLIVNGDTAILVRGGKRSEAPVNASTYHTVKSIAHIPLAIFVALTPGEGALDADRKQTLTGLRNLIPPARASLDGLSLPKETLARQDQMVSQSLAFLDDVLKRDEFTRAALTAYVRKITPMVMANVADATRAQLDVLHKQVTTWRAELTPAEWAKIQVLVIGPHMPRENGVVMQYFAKVLHEPKEGRRIVYAESLWEEPRALDLVGTHLLDGAVGEAFFNDYLRMHRDLLADAARDYLKKLPSR
jgi:hypothetical protein